MHCLLFCLEKSIKDLKATMICFKTLTKKGSIQVRKEVTKIFKKDKRKNMNNRVVAKHNDNGIIRN